MPYTRKDAIKEVGDSKDWLVGLEASIKKWEQRVGGDMKPYGNQEPCGFCFVLDNRKLSCPNCPAYLICRGSHFKSNKEILQALKKLRRELDPMDCKDKCANYKPLEVEKPTEPVGRIFAEDLRVGMVIRRHGTPLPRKLVVILEKPKEFTVKSLQLRTGHLPCESELYLPNSGLQPNKHGSWNRTAWCEEVT